MGRWLGIAIVLAHFVVVLLHGAAHTSLRIGLAPWQTAFVLMVVVIASLVAAILLGIRPSRLVFALLAAAMSGALLFGIYFHYVAISPDHVSRLPAGAAQGTFRLTALLLAITEAISLTIGLVYSRGPTKRE